VGTADDGGAEDGTESYTGEVNFPNQTLPRNIYKKNSNFSNTSVGAVSSGPIKLTSAVKPDSANKDLGEVRLKIRKNSIEPN
jgi:hypothetical protein